MNKKMVLFDLDGTLTRSRQVIDPYPARLLASLLAKRMVGIVSGCAFNRIEEQLLRQLPQDANMANLHLFTSTASSYYIYRHNRWECIYSESFTDMEKQYITGVLLDVCADYIAAHPAGNLIDDRGGQIALALLGVDAPLDVKTKFDPDNRKRYLLKEKLDKILPYEVIVGGTTTISVTRCGINKAHCLDILATGGIAISDILFIGDALYEGGNDYPIKLAGVECLSVTSPADTIGILERLCSTI